MTGSSHGNFNNTIMQYASYAKLKADLDAGKLADGHYSVDGTVYGIKQNSFIGSGKFDSTSSIPNQPGVYQVGGDLIPWIGLDDSSSLASVASDNTTKIQAALDSGGDLFLGRPGNYWVKDVAIIKSSTKVTIAPGVNLLCKNTGNGTFNFFRNEKFNAPKQSIVSITPAVFGEIYRCTVLFSSAPNSAFEVGKGILINNDPTGIYNGIWRVETINTAAKTITFLMDSAFVAPLAVGETTTISGFISNGTSGTPGTILTVKSENPYVLNRSFNNTSNYLQAPGISASTTITSPITGRGGSGTYNVNNSQALGTAAAPVTFTVNTELYAIAADVDITLDIRGNLKSNFSSEGFSARDATSDPLAYNDCGVAFNNIDNLLIETIEVEDCRKYRVLVANHQNLRVNNVYGNNTSDGVKVYGPSFGTPIINGVYGTMGDDGCSFQTVDPAPTYLYYMPPNSGGSFYGGGVIKNSKGRCNAYNGHAVLYPNGGLNAATFDGVYLFGKYVIEECGSELASLPRDYGNTGPGNAFCVESAATSGYVDNIVVINPKGAIRSGPHNSSGVLTNIDTLTVIGHNEDAIGINSIVLFEKANINRLTFVRSRHVNPGMANTNAYFNWKTLLNIGVLQFDDPVISNLSVTSTFASGAGYLFGTYGGGPYTLTVGKVIVNNPQILSNNCNILNCNAVEYVGTPSLTVNNLYDTGTGNAITVGSSQAWDIIVNGAKKASGALFNFYGTGTINVSYENTEVAAAVFVNTQSNVTIKSVRETRTPQRSVPADGATVTATNLNGYNKLIIAPAANLSALTLALPTTPINGEILEVIFTKAVTTLTVTNGTIVGISAGVSAGYSRKLTYSSADTAWV